MRVTRRRWHPGRSAFEGSVTLAPDGSFDYTPNANFNGTDTFRYEATDDEGDDDTAEVTITVIAQNDDPVVVGSGLDDVTMVEDDPALDIDVTTAFDDVDIDTNGDTLDYSVSHSGYPVLRSS
ncbi:MAG: Ig-like domain-containing protein [Gammaproteobacteria bacterium]|nr:Ig-like domain-containing protein [Gammaproteobacteria bacterium]